MITAIYLRVSTDKQDTDSQRHAVEQYVRGKNYPRTEMYIDDAISGATRNRPALQRLMADCRAGTVARIVTFEASRLSRNFLDGLMLMQELTDCGVQVETPAGPVDFATSDDQFLAAVKAYVAARERENISTRTKAGMAAARARGARIGARPGNQNRRGQKKVYAADLVSKCQTLRSNGLSFRAISEFVGVSDTNVRHILTRQEFSAQPRT
jgi:DNA invertase Pin-like site-specific DNA recombinase